MTERRPFCWMVPLRKHVHVIYKAFWGALKIINVRVVLYSSGTMKFSPDKALLRDIIQFSHLAAKRIELSCLVDFYHR